MIARIKGNKVESIFGFRLEVKNMTKVFTERFGGKWKYNRNAGQWDCDDNNRYIINVLTGIDHLGEYTGQTSMCLYYKNGSKSPEWI